MKRYHVFLFDADETLFDFVKAEAAALRNTMEDFGLTYSEAVRQQYHRINDGLWKQFERGAVSRDELQQARFSRLFEALGVSRDAGAFNSRYLTELGRGTYLLDGAYEICQYLRRNRKKLCIVTNGTAAAQRARIGRSELRPFFDELFISEEIGARKPEKLFFERVLTRLASFDPRDMLIVGDSLSSDIAGGNGAGIDTCWFNPQKAENCSGPRRRMRFTA